MAVPKKKISKSRGKMKRAHRALPLINYIICKNCNKLKKPHYICEECITYKKK